MWCSVEVDFFEEKMDQLEKECQEDEESEDTLSEVEGCFVCLTCQ